MWHLQIIMISIITKNDSKVVNDANITMTWRKKREKSKVLKKDTRFLLLWRQKMVPLAQLLLHNLFLDCTYGQMIHLVLYDYCVKSHSLIYFSMPLQTQIASSKHLELMCHMSHDLCKMIVSHASKPVYIYISFFSFFIFIQAPRQTTAPTNIRSK